MESTSAPFLGAMKPNNEIPEFDAFKSVLLYSAGILILPILSFFVSKTFIFDSIYSNNLVTSNVCSAAVAVLVLHISLGVYIYKAYIGTDKTTKKD